MNLPDSQPILDYAGPARKSTFKMASRSCLRIAIEDGQMTIIERLTPTANTWGAMIFAALILLILAGCITAEMPMFFATHRVTSLPVVQITMTLIEIVLFLLVINDTFCTTTLRATGETLALHLRSLFRKRRFDWPAADIQRLDIGPIGREPDSPLQLTIVPYQRQFAFLFGGQPLNELVEVKTQLCRLLGLEHDSAASAQ